MKTLNAIAAVMVVLGIAAFCQHGVAAGTPDIVIVSQPLGLSVTSGATVTFSVMAAGPGAITYQWLHAGMTIAGATSNVLTLTEVRLADAGDYVAYISGSGKQVRSEAATLTVDGLAIADVEGPRVKISSPSSWHARTDLGEFTFIGSATDDTALAGVCYQQGVSPWVEAPTDGTNWSFSTSLFPGTNVFQLKAADIVGNFSATQQLVLFYSVTQQLTLTTVGAGTVSGATNGQGLEIGKNYTLRPTPATGTYFQQWDVNGVISTNPALTFFMGSNQVITATFVGNPFLAVQGTHTALFYDEVLPVHESSGILSFKLTDQGRFTGRMIIGGETVPFLGSFDMNLNARVVAARKLTNPPVTLELQLVPNSDALTGSVVGEDFRSAVVGYRSRFNATTNPATEFAGKFTLAFSGSGDVVEAPKGLGYAVVSVSTAGAVQIKGLLADGVAATQKSPLASNGQWPVYAALYRGGGSIVGWMTIADDGENDVSGRLLWTRPAGFSSIFYPLGFANEVEVKGSRYTVPPTGVPAVTLESPLVYLDGGNLESSLTTDAAVDAFNKVAFPIGATNKLALKVAASSGLVSGSFHNPHTLKKSTIRGVLLQRQNVGSGFFLGTNQGGLFFLGTPESLPVFP